MPWQCQQCKTSIEDDDFELCWNCNTKKAQLKQPPRQQSLALIVCAAKQN